MSTAPAAVVSQDPAAQPDWRAGLPEELRSEKSLESFKDIPSLAKSFVETKKSMGNAIRIPKADAKPEEWDAYYTKTGRPESPDKYEFTRPQLAEGAKYDEDLEKEFRTMAHKAGLQPRQAQVVLDSYNEFSAKRMQAIAPQWAESEAKLKTEWGAKYDKNMAIALEAVKENGGDGYREFLDNSGVGNHPEQIKFVAAMGQKIAELKAKLAQFTSEDQMILGESHQAEDTKESLKLKIDEMERDPKHALNDKTASVDARDAAKKKWTDLYRQLYS